MLHREDIIFRSSDNCSVFRIIQNIQFNRLLDTLEIIEKQHLYIKYFLELLSQSVVKKLERIKKIDIFRSFIRYCSQAPWFCIDCFSKPQSYFFPWWIIERNLLLIMMLRFVITVKGTWIEDPVLYKCLH